MASKSSSRSASPERGLLSRSWTDDGIDQSFLSAAPTKRGGKHPTVVTRTPSISIATSSLNEMSFTQTLDLDDALQSAEAVRPRQVFIHGPLPLAQEPEVFAFLAQNYKIDWKSAPLDDDFIESYGKLLHHNELCARTVGLYRTAQTWKILNFMMTGHLKKRAQIKQNQRTGRNTASHAPHSRGVMSKIASSIMNEGDKSYTPTLASTRPVSAITQQLALANITSDQPTAHKMTVMNVKDSVPPGSNNLSNLEQAERSALPPSTSRRSSAPVNVVNNEDTSIYLPEDGDEDCEETRICYMVDMLRELVTNYVGRGDAQTASHFLLLVGPLLPRTRSLPVVEIELTVATYADYFSTVGYTEEEIQSLLSDNFESIISSGLQPLQIEAVLSNYHQLLMKRKLWNEAAILRKMTYPAYPSVYEGFIKDNHVHLRCGACGKPIGTGTQPLRCESCREKQPLCQICWCEESPFEGDKKSKLLSTCLRCNYTKHATCLQVWIDEDGSGCPGCSA